VLRAFGASETEAFFRALGVTLHEEEDGKLFPDSNRSRDVLDALLREAAACGVMMRTGCRVCAIERNGSGFLVQSEEPRTIACGRVVLATGGRSLPKTGSDGFGYELARRLGHGHVETTPALAPLILDGDRHRALAGVSHVVTLTCGEGRNRTRIAGSMLWTHFGISGPAALNVSRHWHRARLEGRPHPSTVNVCAGESSEEVEAWLLDQRDDRPRARIQTVIATRLPAAIASAWCHSAGIDAEVTMSHLSREQRMALVRALTAMPLSVSDSRGYSYAEVTAGGVPLDEIDPASMESRVCPGLSLVGEILDVDGRLGGFNFQWAWSSAWVAGQALGRSGPATAGPNDWR
jgi:predicted Rossmann fold flavoprotein